MRNCPAECGTVGKYVSLRVPIVCLLNVPKCHILLITAHKLPRSYVNPIILYYMLISDLHNFGGVSYALLVKCGIFFNILRVENGCFRALPSHIRFLYCCNYYQHFLTVYRNMLIYGLFHFPLYLIEMYGKNIWQECIVSSNHKNMGLVEFREILRRNSQQINSTLLCFIVEESFSDFKILNR